MAEAQVFKFQAPQTLDRPKEVVRLCRSDILFGAVQVLGEGGENNLHAHTGMDGLWMVLEGRVRFYGEGNRLIGELGKHEGVLIPRGAMYWFESVGPEPLQILQVEALAQNVQNKRIDYEPLKASARAYVDPSTGTIQSPQAGDS